MILKQYGITYKRLNTEHLEMLREWRNNPEITQFMQKRAHITPEMQLRWFASINNNNNYYFIIQAEGKDIGLINCKNISHKAKNAEIGIFISDASFKKSKVFLYASMTILNFSFNFLKLKEIFAKVIDSNEAFLKIIHKLNFEFADSKGEDVKSQIFSLSKDNYLLLFEKYALINKLLTFEEMNLEIIF